MSANMTVSGLDNLIADIQTFVPETDKAISKGLKAAGEVVAEAEKSHLNRSNKDHKHIIDDITTSRVSNKDGVKSVYTGPTSKTAYRGRWLEEGTSKMPAHPWALPAANESEKEATRVMVSHLKEAIK